MIKLWQMLNFYQTLLNMIDINQNFTKIQKHISQKELQRKKVQKGINFFKSNNVLIKEVEKI